MRAILTSSVIATAAATASTAESAGRIGPSRGRSRPLRLARLEAAQEPLLPRGTWELLARRQTSVSAEMGEMQLWHDASEQRRQSSALERGGLQALRGGAGMQAMKSKPAFLERVQNGLASSRAVIMWFVKGLLAAFTGLLTTSAVMVAFEFTAHKVSPITGMT
jgi:hypothetical protein